MVTCFSGAHSCPLDDGGRRWFRTTDPLRVGSKCNVTHVGTYCGIAYLWVAVGGHPRHPLAAHLGVPPQAIYQAVAGGRESREEWDRLLPGEN